jgi:hypothetical protein
VVGTLGYVHLGSGRLFVLGAVEDGPGGAQQLGAPRSRAMIITALADRHPKDDVRRTLMRLAVTEQLVEKGGKYTLPAPGVEQG